MQCLHHGGMLPLNVFQLLFGFSELHRQELNFLVSHSYRLERVVLSQLPGFDGNLQVGLTLLQSFLCAFQISLPLLQLKRQRLRSTRLRLQLTSRPLQFLNLRISISQLPLKSRFHFDHFLSEFGQRCVPFRQLYFIIRSAFPFLF